MERLSCGENHILGAVVGSVLVASVKTSVEGEVAESDGSAENGGSSALDIVLNDLGNVDANELIALRSIGTKEVAELREEEGDLGLRLTITQPRFIGREDPLAELALSGRRSERSSLSVRRGQGKGMFHHV